MVFLSPWWKTFEEAAVGVAVAAVRVVVVAVDVVRVVVVVVAAGGVVVVVVVAVSIPVMAVFFVVMIYVAVIAFITFCDVWSFSISSGCNGWCDDFCESKGC